jgi:thioredoxin-related protein
MKNPILTLTALFLLALSVQAGDKSAWLTNLDEAMSKAKAENKIVMIEFHGSDWCPPCIQLNDEILSTAAFKALAESSLVLVNADFPRTVEQPADVKARNQELAGKFGIRGFPTVVLLDSEGDVLDKMVGFPRGGLDGFLSFIQDQVPDEKEG